MLYVAWFGVNVRDSNLNGAEFLKNVIICNVLELQRILEWAQDLIVLTLRVIIFFYINHFQI